MTRNTPPEAGKTRETYDLKTMKRTKSLKFLYGNRLGVLALRIASSRWIANLMGCYLNSRLSKRGIVKFIKNNGINMSEYEQVKYRSFNDFFTRRIRSECRPFDGEDSSLISPCDAKLTAFHIKEDRLFHIKNIDYTLSELLKNEELAREYYGGICLIFRLTVTDYHRYIFFDSGTAEKPVFIKGRLHTVQPEACERRKVFAENCREYTLLHTNNFGDAIQMEVGAMFVGRITNNGKTKFERGEEKGYFEFGGSTVILLLKKDVAEIDGEITSNTRELLETVVKCGERIGGTPCWRLQGKRR